MQLGGEKIRQVKTYACGTCSNHLDQVFEATGPENREFPATVLLFQHGEDTYLVDTGYSERVLENGWRSWAYNRVIPVHFKKEEGLRTQLVNEGINPSSIKGIMLTHLHPDHVAGLIDFPDIPILMSKGSYETYQHPKLLDLVFKNLFPKDFEDRLTLLDASQKDIDFFGDGSLILTDLSGHSKGQLGFLFPEFSLLYAADAAWGMDLLGKKLKLKARLIQNDMQTYEKTLDKLQTFQSQGVQVVVSHDINL